jgi:hypothetical protein
LVQCEEAVAMYQSVSDAFLSFNEPLEGRVRFMYLDVKSLVSTGVGNLLDADDPDHFGSNPKPVPETFTLGWFDKTTLVPAGQGEIEQEYRTVKFSGTALAPLPAKEAVTRLRIADQSIDDLVGSKLAGFEAALRARAAFAALESWPADGQLGLFSMAWAMGPLFRFPKFESAAAQGLWLTMAHECTMSEAGNPGVIPRNVRDGLLFTLAGWNADPPPGDFTRLFFDVSRKLDANMRSGDFPVPLNLSIGVQTALEDLGFDPHGLDGVFGAGTRGALTSFQDANQLLQTPGARGVDDVPQETIDALAAQLDTKGFGHFR